MLSIGDLVENSGQIVFPPVKPSAPGLQQVASLLAWYDIHARSLPWRAGPGVRADPYAVWLSEIMLQQTTVAAVKPYFEAFLERWPDVAALAKAPLDDVLTAWAGLGYYARARNLHACARIVAGELDGQFPVDPAALKRLPGIGDYTAAAVAAIAFGQSATVVDGNVERVMARVFAVATPLPAAKPQLRALADTLTPSDRPGDYAQAVMDLGATVCIAGRPRCAVCPWAEICAGRAAGIAETLPRRLPKRARPIRYGVAFWITNQDGAVLLRRRPPRGLLGGMMEIPSSDWIEAPPGGIATANGAAPLDLRFKQLPGLVRHTFTHFHLELSVLAGRIENNVAADTHGVWVLVDRLGEQALPSLMRKVAEHALRHLEE